VKVLVTGGCGYIGQHVVEACCAAGHKVTVVDSGSAFSGIFDGTMLHGMRLDAMSPFVSYHDAVIHLAASISVAESVREPHLYYTNNVVEGIKLLEWCRRVRASKIIFASSAAVYGPNDGSPIDEELPCRPANPYAASKLILEWALADYARAYGIQAIPLRLFNVAGGSFREEHEPETHLIPNLVDAAYYGRPVTIHHSPKHGTHGATDTCERDYVNVRDVARAFVAAVEGSIDLAAGEAINIGSGGAHTTRYVIAAVGRATGRKLDVRMEPARPGDVATLCADIAKARAVLGWTPQHSSIEEIVRDTIATRSPTA